MPIATHDGPFLGTVESAQASNTSGAGAAGIPAISVSNGTVATLAGGERLMLQNLEATNQLYVRLGGTASATVFHFVIPGNTGAKDGSSPPMMVENWIGIVSVFSAGTPSYMANVLS